MNRTVHFAFVLTLLATFFAHSAQTADAKKPAGEKISVMGKVSTTKKDVDEFTSIKLTATDGKVYNITARRQRQ